MANRKNPWLVAGLSILYPGLGHAFMGEMGKGFMYITIHSFLLFVGLISLGFLGLPALIFWLFAIITSLTGVEKINKGELTPEFQTPRSVRRSFGITVLIGFVPIYFFPFQTYFSMYDRLPFEKSKVQAYFQQSVEQKYSLKAQVQKVNYSFNAGDTNGRFEAEAILANYPDIPFHVSVSGKDSLQAPVNDTFIEEYVSHQVSGKYQSLINRLLEKEAFSHAKIWVNGIGTKEDRLEVEKLKQNPEPYMRVSISFLSSSKSMQSRQVPCHREAKPCNLLLGRISLCCLNGLSEEVT